MQADAQFGSDASLPAAQARPGLDTRPMTVGEWMLTILVLAIPVVNLVMYLVWALGSTGNVNRKTFCQASLLWFAILVGLAILVSLFAVVGMGLLS